MCLWRNHNGNHNFLWWAYAWEWVQIKSQPGIRNIVETELTEFKVSLETIWFTTTTSNERNPTILTAACRRLWPDLHTNGWLAFWSTAGLLLIWLRKMCGESALESALQIVTITFTLEAFCLPLVLKLVLQVALAEESAPTFRYHQIALSPLIRLDTEDVQPPTFNLWPSTFSFLPPAFETFQLKTFSLIFCSATLIL